LLATALMNWCVSPLLCGRAVPFCTMAYMKKCRQSENRRRREGPSRGLPRLQSPCGVFAAAAILPAADYFQDRFFPPSLLTMRVRQHLGNTRPHSRISFTMKWEVLTRGLFLPAAVWPHHGMGTIGFAIFFAMPTNPTPLGATIVRRDAASGY